MTMENSEELGGRDIHSVDAKRTTEEWDAEVEAAIAGGDVPETLRIILDANALIEAKALVATPEHTGKSLRVYLEGKGCDGFFYGVAFDQPTPQDLSWMQGTLPVHVDREAFRFLSASRIVWVDDERGRGFLVENPQHRRFRGKFFKKTAWRDRLEGAKGTADT